MLNFTREDNEKHLELYLRHTDPTSWSFRQAEDLLAMHELLELCADVPWDSVIWRQLSAGGVHAVLVGTIRDKVRELRGEQEPAP